MKAKLSIILIFCTALFISYNAQAQTENLEGQKVAKAYATVTTAPEIYYHQSNDYYIDFKFNYSYPVGLHSWTNFRVQYRKYRTTDAWTFVTSICPIYPHTFITGYFTINNLRQDTTYEVRMVEDISGYTTTSYICSTWAE